MTTMTRPSPSRSASAGSTPNQWTKRSAVGPASRSPENAPLTMATSVMPICADDRNLFGSAASFSAAAAPLLPLAASPRSRGRRDDTMASSDMARKPLSPISARMITASNQGKGCIGS